MGSGSVEATGRRTQCHFKTAPGEAFLCPEMFSLDFRWHLPFPHTIFNPARN
jgi:hypothetical protein